MKDQPWRRELQSYDFLHQMQPRFADIDTERHVNNVALHGLHAEACVRYQLQLLGEPAWHPAACILHPVQVETVFLQIAHYQNPIQCGVRMTEVDEHGCTLSSALFQHGVCVGIQEQRIALWRAGRTLPLPIAVRTSLLEHKTGPEAALAASIESRSAIAADIGAYPLVSALTTRSEDLDAEACTGTLALLSYAQQARTQLVFTALDHAAIDLNRGPLGLLVARTGIDILGRRAAQGEVRLAAAAFRQGSSSFALRSAVFDRQGCLAVSESVMVLIRRDDGKATPLPQKLRDYFSGPAELKISPPCAMT